MEQQEQLNTTTTNQNPNENTQPDENNNNKTPSKIEPPSSEQIVSTVIPTSTVNGGNQQRTVLKRKKVLVRKPLPSTTNTNSNANTTTNTTISDVSGGEQEKLELMSECDLIVAIERTGRSVALVEHKLPDKGAKLKAYIHRLQQEFKRRRVEDTKSFIKVGPCGIATGQAWEEKGYKLLSQIFISSEQDCICGLQFQYVVDGKLLLSPIYGRHSGCNFATVKFSDISEYITRVNGSVGYSNQVRAVSSITIETNKTSYGPFGSSEKGDTNFSYQFGPGNQFGGFYGTFHFVRPIPMLSSIGVYVKPSIDLDDFLSPSP